MLVRNPSTYFNLSQPRFVRLRDSGSFEMQLRKMYELQTRSVVHFNDYVKRGYNVYFFTLTYDNDSLSWYTYSDGKCVGSCRCINRDVVIKFFKDIRKYCDRYFNVHDIPYLMADERGGKRKRPHHHLLIAFPSSMTKRDVYDCISYCWCYVVRNDDGKILRDVDGHPLRRQYGYILPSNPDGDNFHRGILVETSNTSYACRYASKYVLKNLEDNKDKDVNIVRAMILHEKDWKSYALFKRSQCKIKLSLGFGRSIERLCLESDDVFDSLLNGVNIPEICQEQKIQLTSYNLRRMLRSRVLDRVEKDFERKSVLVQHPIFHKHLLRYVKKDFERRYYKTVLNDLGKLFENYKYDSVVDNLALCFEKRRSLILSDHAFFRHFDLDYDRVCSLLDVNLYHVAVYSYVYRDRVSPSHLELYNTRRDIFSTYISYDKMVKVRFGRGYKWIFSEDYVKDYQFIIAPYYASCAYLPQPNDWVLPNGTESIETMVAFGKSFKCLQTEFDYKDFCENKFRYDHYNLFFNSFPCFRGYDDILDVFELYAYFKSGKYENIIRSIDFATQIRQDLTENGDGFVN